MDITHGRCSRSSTSCEAVRHQGVPNSGKTGPDPVFPLFGKAGWRVACGLSATDEGGLAPALPRCVDAVAQFPDEMGRLGVAHATALLRDGTIPPPEILTKVEIIHLANLASFEEAARSGTGAGEAR